MSSVYVEITLKNGGDVVLARNGHIKERNIRTLTTTALVNTGVMTLVIGEEMREKLGIVISSSVTGGAQLNPEAPCSITEPIEVCWGDRTACVRTWVLANEKEVLLGVIPLEDMNLIRSTKLKRDERAA